MKKYRIAASPGDGIRTEVIAAGVEVLRALAERESGFSFQVDLSTGAGRTTRRTAA